MKPPRLLKFTSVEYVKDHELRVRFSDGTEGVADYSDDTIGYLAPLQSPETFARVQLSHGALSWRELDIDIATEHTYALAHGLPPPKDEAEVNRNFLAVRRRWEGAD